MTRYGKSGVLFYSVLYEDTVQNANDFIKSYGEAAVVLLDPELKTAINYGVAGVPETFFIDTEGRVTYKHAGVLTPDLLYEKLGSPVHRLYSLLKNDRVTLLSLGRALSMQCSSLEPRSTSRADR